MHLSGMIFKVKLYSQVAESALEEKENQTGNCQTLGNYYRNVHTVQKHTHRT